MRNLLFIVLVLVLPVVALSQTSTGISIKIKGQIADSVDLKSIPYATITIMKIPENSVEKRIATDVNGFFETSLKTSGNYIIVANSLGYTSTRKPFTVNNAGQLLDLGKLTLKQASVELGEVQVIGEKPLVKIEADKLSYNAEADPETKTSNALDLLKKVPLITVDGEDNVQLKGSSNYKVFMNGKPSTMASNNTKDFLKNLPASTIKNIEVITSPGAKYDAEGIGGIINIITQKKTMNGYTCSVNLGTSTLGSANGGVSFSGAVGKFGMSVNFYNYYQNNPYMDYNTYRIDTTQATSLWDGRSKYEGMSRWSDGEISYEFDTLNLINASFTFWNAKNKNLSNSTVSLRDENQIENTAFSMNGVNNYTYGAPEGSIDYQHTSKRNKEQIFTLSYKVNYNPIGNDGESNINSILNYGDSWKKTDNNAHSIEHTFQADYVKPIIYKFKLEMGLKYILRRNVSTTDALAYDYINQQFVIDSSQINDFDYTQNIYASYLTVNKNIKKFGFKAGLRVEDVFIDGTFTSKSFTNFKNTNLEFVPSATISYQINQSNNLRLSYSKRIQRPDIWYLNPFVNTSDPLNIYFGNPNLSPERFHNFELNFGSFSKLGNINITLFNSFSNNGIDRWSVKENNVIKSSYGNIDKIQNWGISSYISIKLGKKVSTNINGSVTYSTINVNDNSGLKNEGWGYNIYSNLQYTIVKGLKVTGYGALYQNPARLQYKSSLFYNVGVSIGKDLMNSKMSITLSARNVFWKEMKYTYKSSGSNYSQKSEMFRPGYNLSFSISYRFGEMKTQLKKTQRKIQNDDVKKGEGGGGSGN